MERNVKERYSLRKLTNHQSQQFSTLRRSRSIRASFRLLNSKHKLSSSSSTSSNKSSYNDVKITSITNYNELKNSHNNIIDTNSIILDDNVKIFNFNKCENNENLKNKLNIEFKSSHNNYNNSIQNELISQKSSIITNNTITTTQTKNVHLNRGAIQKIKTIPKKGSFNKIERFLLNQNSNKYKNLKIETCYNPTGENYENTNNNDLIRDIGVKITKKSSNIDNENTRTKIATIRKGSVWANSHYSKN